MAISGIGSSPNPSQGFLPSFGQLQNNTDSLLISQLPSISSSLPGIGGNLDIYAAVSKQSQGFLSSGLTAMELANVSLGVDMSQVFTNNAAGGSSASTDQTSQAADNSTTTATTNTSSHTNTILNDILKADGFVAPASDPNVVQKDFFADQTKVAGTPTPYFTSPNFTNPSLGGLINSLG